MNDDKHKIYKIENQDIDSIMGMLSLADMYLNEEGFQNIFEAYDEIHRAEEKLHELSEEIYQHYKVAYQERKRQQEER